MALEQFIILVTAVAVAIVPVILIVANQRSKVRVDDDDRGVSLVAFDLHEKDGEDSRPLPLAERERRLAHLLQSVKAGIELNEHPEGDGADIFRARLLTWSRRHRRQAEGFTLRERAIDAVSKD